MQLVAWAPASALLVGAVAVRPIADDYEVLGIYAKTGSVPGSFAYWMTHWSATYSLHATYSLTAAAATAVGVQWIYPLSAISLIVLILVVTAQLAQAWRRHVGVHLPRAAPVILAAIVAGLMTLRNAGEPGAFGFFYWESAAVPHVVPLLLLCPVLLLSQRLAGACHRRSAGLGMGVGFLAAGFVVGGFAFAESAIDVWVTVVTVATVWVLRGRRLPPQWPWHLALCVGLVSGLAVMVFSPGTALRQSMYTPGLFDQPSLIAAVQLLASRAHYSLVRMALSPAPASGFVAGYFLRATAGSPLSIGEDRAVRAWALALLMMLAGAWALVVVGDAAAYAGWWHMFPLWILETIAAVLCGYWRAVRSRRGRRHRWVSTAWIVIVAWATVVASYAASQTWQRAEVFDANIAATRADAPDEPVRWHSLSVGDIADLQPDPTFWVNGYAATWLGRPAASVMVVSAHDVTAAPPVPDLRRLIHH